MRFFKFTSFLVMLLMLAGCKHIQPSGEAWLNAADIHFCESNALSAASIDYPDYPIISDRSPIFTIGDWRKPTITVYVPVRFPGQDPSFVYYTFSCSSNFEGDADVFRFERKSQHSLKLIDRGSRLVDTDKVIEIR
jgi:hypothetical protein